MTAAEMWRQARILHHFPDTPIARRIFATGLRTGIVKCAEDPEMDGMLAFNDSIKEFIDATFQAQGPAPVLSSGGRAVSENEDCVKFYEREFYPLSNFSAFTLMWFVSPREGRRRFDTSEAVYHWEKFRGDVPTHDQRCVQNLIMNAISAHEAYKIAEANRKDRRPNWDAEKVEVMRRIIRAKADQHEYVRRKLLETGDRPLVEDSWRDDFWGWGPNRDGQNMLGKLWMEIRNELRA